MTSTTTPTTAVVELPWPEFLARFNWQQGEHVSLIGPTGGGKTTVAVQLLDRRRYVCAMGTKPKDDTFEALKRAGYREVRELPERGQPPRVIVWPRATTLDKVARRRNADAIRAALDRGYSAGGWTLFVDELSYVANTLGLKSELADIWDQGRAVKVSLIGTTQRPRHIPLQAYSAATHLFLWRNNDRQDIDRLAGLNGADTASIRKIVPNLKRLRGAGGGEVLYVNTRTGELCITLPDKL